MISYSKPLYDTIESAVGSRAWYLLAELVGVLEQWIEVAEQERHLVGRQEQLRGVGVDGLQGRL